MSTIAADYVALARAVAAATPLPSVRRLWIPAPAAAAPAGNGFGALFLDDGSVGLMYVLLDDTLAQIATRLGGAARAGVDPLELAAGFTDPDPARKALALAALNAIGQHVLGRSGLALDYAADSVAGLDPQPGDQVGMVGYFPTLVASLRRRGIALTVIELDPALVQREGNFEVTLRASALERCNKVLCTSTVVLNDSIDRMLEHCRRAERLTLVGPGAGFLPDPLFARGVDTVGGNRVVDAADFLARCRRHDKWGPSARKYCLHRTGYPGCAALLAGLRAGAGRSG